MRRSATSPTARAPCCAINSPGLTTGAPLAIISATTDPTGAKDPEYLLSRKGYTLRRPYVTEDGEEITSAARLLSHLFVAEDGPTFALVLAGPLALITEATRWAEGRYLVIDLQVVTERAEDARGGETDRALTCLAAQSLAPDAEGSIWWSSVLEESVKHTVGVSQDLRDGVRESIEIIANEVVARRRAQGLEPLPADQAQPLARQSLRFLYRILFLLYAEASRNWGCCLRGRMPTSAATAWTGCGNSPWWSSPIRPTSAARTCTTRWPCSSASWIKARLIKALLIRAQPTRALLIKAQPTRPFRKRTPLRTTALPTSRR